MKQKVPIVCSGASTSMNWWGKRLLGIGGRAALFARTIMSEDERKRARLITLSSSIGLPVYEVQLFEIPRETQKLIKVCGQLERAGWKMSFRLTDPTDGRLVFRHLNVSSRLVAVTVGRLGLADRCSASVSVYKDPTISGTVLIDSGDVWLELVYGPHYWLTKTPPPGITVLRCWYRFPHLSVEYSTTEPEQREVLLDNLNDIVRMSLGMGLRQLPETGRSLYAEYHWREDLGYRFLDCSCSWAWTSSAARVI